MRVQYEEVKCGKTVGTHGISVHDDCKGSQIDAQAMGLSVWLAWVVKFMIELARKL